MLVKSLLLFLYCSLFFCCFKTERTFTDDEVKEKIDNYITELVKCRNLTGGMLAVVRNGSILLTKGYGFSNIARNESATANTKFAIGSITKSFTVHLLMKLLREKNLSIDTKVKDLWPGFTAWSGYRYKESTLRDFLAHKTGIPRHDMLWILGGQDRETLLNKIRHFKPIYSLRTNFHYSNTFYMVAGKVAEMIADNGQDWENLLEENFFTPLEMENAGFFDRQETYDGFATPYMPYPLPGGLESDMQEVSYSSWQNSRIVGPSGSIVGSANDMAKWLAMLLNNGIALNGRRTIAEEDLERVFYPEMAFEDNISDMFPGRKNLNRRTSYGLGYYNGYKQGIEYKSHSGSVPGFLSSHSLIRSMKSGYLWTTNHGKRSIEFVVIENVINDFLMSKEPSIPLKEACSLSSSKVPTIDQTIEPPPLSQITNYNKLPSNKLDNNTLSKYTGRYDHWAYGPIYVKRQGGALFQLSLEYGNIGRFNLLNIEEGLFVAFSKPGPGIIFSNHLFQFSNENAEKMTKLEALSFEVYNPPIFERSLGPEPPLNHDKCED